MSTSRRCLQTCVQFLKRPDLDSRRIANRRFPTPRTYAQAALKETEDSGFEATRTFSQREASQARTYHREEPMGASRWRDAHSPEPLAEHLNQLFSPLKFPPELAHRILTHGSHQTARYHGHNSGLSFMGRRVMESYLHLFLNASSVLKPTHDLEAIASHALNSKVLGEYVGSAWGYGKVLQWTPAVSRKELEEAADVGKAWKRIGFYKVQGDAVSATLGAVFQQYGAAVAHRLFHTRILPLLLVPGGLSTEFETEVVALSKRMRGNLLTGQSRSSQSSSPPSTQ